MRIAFLLGVPLMLLSLVPLAARGAAPTVLPIPNGGFEQGLAGWSIPPKEGMTTLATDQAASGKCSLHIVDNDTRKGSDARANPLRVKPEGVYQLRGKVLTVSGGGLGVYVRVLDEKGRPVVSEETFQQGLGGSDGRWRPFLLWIFTPARTAALQVHIHSYNAAKVDAYLDDLELVDLCGIPARRPWEAQYKIRPEEAARLTPADVVGPDGIVYPNWTRCGMQGGIPEVKPIVTVEECGGKPDDNLDDAPALEQAVRKAAAKGGGAILFAAGTYHLDRPVTIRDQGIVLRGQGRDKTRILFRYAIPASGAAFYTPAPGARVGSNTPIELHALPTGLHAMTVRADATTIHTWKRGPHSGNTFSCSTNGGKIVGKLPDGSHTLTGVAEYDDGSKRECSIPIVVDARWKTSAPVASSQAAITFQGPGLDSLRVKLTRDGKRGDVRIAVESARGLAAGDCIRIRAPATPRWKDLIQDSCFWSDFRVYDLQLERIEGNELVLGQPLRIEFPVIDGAYVQKLVPIQRCGVENLHIEQTENLWISAVVFSYGWNCWGKGVTVRMCGRFPICGLYAKWCEIRDCVFDDAWFKGGGGTAYAGWFHSCDCLMEGVETFRFRHAPLFEAAASGNVIRKGVFHESDGQWHSGWTNENLFEQCVIASTRGNGGYAYGLWASPPEDEAHGPNGPRNVVYNCDVRSPKDGLWMGGMNEGWLILYSRFVVQGGPGVTAKTASFDHIIRGNVFVLNDGKSPMINLLTPDCLGIEAVDNLLVGGNGKTIAGLTPLALDKGNRVLPPGGAAPRPQPAVPSIYEWQQARARDHRRSP